ncbi:uncharacterized protein F5891DRAFT_994885 [Suillus fuscotomentosus]|uniref:TFA2 Winged helix domain-containing protein n=1 Tax=Suillus fuscotomentosus TaxID=1912939 RepID=A0AAD4HWK4_9AGAM|nr:uncharacterized protein F5891DRAFT_994885 [Suillus fuscotomentosus]KAG1908804.1 hypothetical protein F5891DRAFT_994885 [Suillus fuscotomentosus]
MVVRVLASEAYDHEISHVKPATLRNTCDMCALKEFWKEAPQAIEELKEGEVLVTRIVKDGQLRVVFWNEIKPGDEICFEQNSLIRGIR